jgi:hypothetical protein
MKPAKDRVQVPETLSQEALIKGLHWGDFHEAA